MLVIRGKSVQHPREIQRGPISTGPVLASRFVASCGCGGLYDGPDGQEALRLTTEHNTTTGHTAHLHGEVRR